MELGNASELSKWQSEQFKQGKSINLTPAQNEGWNKRALCLNPLEAAQADRDLLDMDKHFVKSLEGKYLGDLHTHKEELNQEKGEMVNNSDYTKPVNDNWVSIVDIKDVTGEKVMDSKAQEFVDLLNEVELKPTIFHKKLERHIYGADCNIYPTIQPKINPETGLEKIIKFKDKGVEKDIVELESRPTTYRDLIEYILSTYETKDFKKTMLLRKINKKIANLQKDEFFELDNLEQKAFLQTLIANPDFLEKYKILDVSIWSQLYSFFDLDYRNFPQISDVSKAQEKTLDDKIVETKDIFNVNSGAFAQEPYSLLKFIEINQKHVKIKKPKINPETGLPVYTNALMKNLVFENSNMNLGDMIHIAIRSYKTRDLRKVAIISNLFNKMINIYHEWGKVNATQELTPLMPFVIDSMVEKLLLVRMIAFCPDFNTALKGYIFELFDVDESFLPELVGV